MTQIDNFFGCRHSNIVSHLYYTLINIFTFIFLNPKTWMLSRQPYCPFKIAQTELVISALFDGGDILHSSNTNAAQEPQKRGDP